MVSEKDVQDVASLARLAIEPQRLPSLVRELNGILDHMDVLDSVDVPKGVADASAPAVMPMRPDSDGSPIPLAVPREAFAPETRDGFFLVPRLATHEDQGERAP